jgi:hypothetical protein
VAKLWRYDWCGRHVAAREINVKREITSIFVGSDATERRIDERIGMLDLESRKTRLPCRAFFRPSFSVCEKNDLQRKRALNRARTYADG